MKVARTVWKGGKFREESTYSYYNRYPDSIAIMNTPQLNDRCVKFPQFLRFFAPEVYEAIDFQMPFTFLDTEMEQRAQQALKGAKVADKLVKAFLKDGSEQWILIHIEVQGDADADFSLRMFRYFYRIFDRHGEQVISIAVLTERASGTADGIRSIG